MPTHFYDNLILSGQTKHDLEELVDAINAGRPQCPVGLNTLVIPRKAAAESAQQQQPYVYLKCGHVQGHHDWGQEKDKGTRRCPMCLIAGPIVKLCMGIEPAFYVDSGPPTYAFSPCGHMATEKTVKYVKNYSILFFLHYQFRNFEIITVLYLKIIIYLLFFFPKFVKKIGWGSKFTTTKSRKVDIPEFRNFDY